MTRFLKIVLLALCVGCSKTPAEEERILAIKNARQVASQSFVDQNPVDSLYAALTDCKKVLEKCTVLNEPLQVFSDGLASCRDGTEMCATLQEFKESGHPLMEHLPAPRSIIAMPSHPFYVSIGNSLLDYQASLFKYRTELFWLWWARHKNFIIFTFTFIFSIAFISIQKRYLKSLKESEGKRDLERHQIEQHEMSRLAELKRVNEILERQRIIEQAQREAEQQAEQEYQAELDRIDEERVAEEKAKLAKQVQEQKMKEDIIAAMKSSKKR